MRAPANLARSCEGPHRRGCWKAVLDSDTGPNLWDFRSNSNLEFQLRQEAVAKGYRTARNEYAPGGVIASELLGLQKCKIIAPSPEG